MFFKKITCLIILACGLFFTINVFADGTIPSEPVQQTQSNAQNASPLGTDGLGGVANNLMAPVEVMSSFLTGMAIIIGLTCLFGGFVRYMQHRVNPLANPIGTVVTLVILGTVLLLLPLVYKLTESGVQGTLH